MKRKDAVILSVVLVLIIALIVVLIFFMPRSSENHYSWTETYRQKSDQPFGTSVVSELLKGYFNDNQFTIVKNNLEETLGDDSPTHRNYVFIGWEPYLSDSVFRLLTDFVYKGNDAFFAVKEIPDKLSNRIFKNWASGLSADSAFYTTEYGDTVWYLKPKVEFDTMAFSYFSADHISMNFIPGKFQRDSSFDFKYVVRDESKMYEWQYFLPGYASTLIDFDSLGSLHSNNFLNYIRIPFGRGNFYIHSNPIVFTNFFQVQEKNIEYTSKVFSYLKPGDIIWDEASKTNDYDYGDGFDFSNESEGPLKFILAQQSLRWGWYVLLAGLLVFLFFRTKRMQQPIPVMETNENNSLEFIQTIGRMYFISKDHKLMAQQKMKLFLHFIGDHYHIPTSELNDDFYNRLHLKSEIPMSDIKTIFGHYRYIENTTDVTPDDLMYFHQILDSFYKNCK